jgi:hypothetical protein
MAIKRGGFYGKGFQAGKSQSYGSANQAFEAEIDPYGNRWTERQHVTARSAYEQFSNGFADGEDWRSRHNGRSNPLPVGRCVTVKAIRRKNGRVDIYGIQ